MSNRTQLLGHFGASKSMKSFVCMASLISALQGLSNPALAQSRNNAEAFPSERATSPRIRAGNNDTVSARSIEMGVGRSIVVDLPRDAKEVFVANPAIANAVVRSARKLFIIGVANGSTTIMALDGDGQQIAAFEMQVGREPGLLQKTIRAALPHANIKAVSIGDSIVLTGMVDTVLEAQKAVDITKGFVGLSATANGNVEGRVINSMTVRGKDQVMLKVVVAEVKRTAIKQLGVNIKGNWELGGKTLGGQVENAFSGGLIQPPNFLSAGAQLGTNVAKQVDVKALERHGVLRTLAEPTLTAISGETAKFVAGGEIPVPKSEETTQGSLLLGQGSTKITLEYKPVGVMLNFTPVVLSEGRISLSIATEVTEIDAENSISIGKSNSPAFRTRKAYTTIELPSGGSLVTAGLIQQVSRQAINGLPGLLNVPVIGSFFRSRDFYREETELMIIVTPYIAKPSDPKSLARPDDGFTEASDPSAILLGRLNKVYGAAGSPVPPTQYRGKVGFIHE
ncbi:MAG: type II and III secretion system protein family protein [Beijerinckiaceae bacterium]